MVAVLASAFVHLGIKGKLEHRLPDQKQPPSRGSTFSIAAPSRTLRTQQTSRHPATTLNRAGGRIALVHLRLFLAKTTSFCYCSAQAGSLREPSSASNFREPLCRKPTHFSAVADHPSAASSSSRRVSAALALGPPRRSLVAHDVQQRARQIGFARLLALRQELRKGRPWLGCGSQTTVDPSLLRVKEMVPRLHESC
jgi:hypothetical protein